jgi:murein DD-endopeptidase MepM/ murein hydrolase activator NlpD
MAVLAVSVRVAAAATGLPTLPTVGLPSPSVPTLPPLLSPSASPSPTPTPTPDAGLGLPAVPSLPSVQSILPGPPGAGSPPPPSGAPPASGPPASLSTGFAPGSAARAAGIAGDAAAISRLTGAISLPETMRPPSLRHLWLGTSQAALGARTAAGAAGGPDGPAPLGAELPLLFGCLLFLGVLLVPGGDAAVRRWLAGLDLRLPRPDGFRAGAAALGAAAVALAVGGTSVVTQPSAAPVAPAQAVALSTVTSGSSGHLAAARPLAAVQSASLADLNRIESHVLTSRTRVIAAQTTIKQLAAAPADAALATTGPAQPADPVSGLSQALTVDQTAQADYQSALQAEFEYFSGLARDTGKRDALLGAVAATGDKEALGAVEYDLQVVSAALAQEDAIAAARSAAAAGESGVLLTPPMSGSISQGFGPSALSFEPPREVAGVFYPHFHTGLDIANAYGTPVRAAATGVVVLAGSSVDGAGNLVGYGNYVVIQHADGYRTLYGHLAELDVSAGQAVVEGQQIGREGSTGWSTGPHLHFEVRHDGDVVDPVPYLNGVQAI